MERWCVDRFENGYAVMENERRESRSVDAALLPDGVRVGDWLRLEDAIWTPDITYTEDTARRIANKMKRLWRS